MAWLMIPGPIEISDAVAQAAAQRPQSHVSASIKEQFGRGLRQLREVFSAPPSSSVFACAGGGTFVMEMAATNLVDSGEVVVVASMGVFGERMAEMCRRRGATVRVVCSEPGEAVDLQAVRRALKGATSLFLTHVDTSTGVRCDLKSLAALGREADVLVVVDGVCSVAGEELLMADWGVDFALTASQKAVGMPPGMALAVASERAMSKRATLKTPPPMVLDLEVWRPIFEAYEQNGAAYFSTPPTTLLPALAVATDELLAVGGIKQRVEEHARCASAARQAWSALGLRLVATNTKWAANTLSALYLPPGVNSAEFRSKVAEAGAVVAGGLHPDLKQSTFRVGHMGIVTRQSTAMVDTVRAVAFGLIGCGVSVDVQAAVEKVQF